MFMNKCNLSAWRHYGVSGCCKPRLHVLNYNQAQTAPFCTKKKLCSGFRLPGQVEANYSHLKDDMQWQHQDKICGLQEKHVFWQRLPYDLHNLFITPLLSGIPSKILPIQISLEVCTVYKNIINEDNIYRTYNQYPKLANNSTINHLKLTNNTGRLCQPSAQEREEI